MQVMQTKIIEPGNGLKYRIQMREVHGIWEQRHIWYPAPETYVSKPTVDHAGWIKSWGGLGLGFEATETPDEDVTA